MTISATSLAAANAVSVRNVQFAPTSEVLARKIVVIGTYDPSKTTVVANAPVQVLNEADAGNRYGFGFMLHRLVKAAFNGSKGVECWCVPQAEPGAGSAAAGTITVAGTATAAGTVHLYVAGDYVPVNIAKGSTAAQAATAITAAITAATDLPVTAAVDGSTPEEIDVTAKTSGTYGNEIKMRLNVFAGQELPAGITAVTIVDLATGAGTPTIADALNGLGTGDQANAQHFTDGVHGYLQDSTTLTAISAYNGEGNDATGLYDKLVARPLRFLTGDIDAGSDGLAALIVIGNAARATDRTNGIVAVPDSPNHPSEIAATTIGVMARTNNDRAEECYVGKLLPGVIAGRQVVIAAAAGRWTDTYDNRDSAVKAGISPTVADSGFTVRLQNVLTFYHPVSVPTSSNGYRSMRNISIIQNLLNGVKVNFAQEKWQGISIVEDINKVSNALSKDKARSVASVITDLVALADAWASRAWLYNATFTKENLSVEIRSGGIGFDSVVPVVLSGEGGILDTRVDFDTALTVFLA
jgi:phage tail sheath gpL-like